MIRTIVGVGEIHLVVDFLRKKLEHGFTDVKIWRQRHVAGEQAIVIITRLVWRKQMISKFLFATFTQIINLIWKLTIHTSLALNILVKQSSVKAYHKLTFAKH